MPSTMAPSRSASAPALDSPHEVPPARLPMMSAGGTCHIRVVKERPACPVAIAGAVAPASRRAPGIWCPTRDSNPDHRVSETRAYAVSASGAWRDPNKKPGGLAAHPGFRLKTQHALHHQRPPERRTDRIERESALSRRKRASGPERTERTGAPRLRHGRSRAWRVLCVLQYPFVLHRLHRIGSVYSLTTAA